MSQAFIDASAIVAIATKESNWSVLSTRIMEIETKYTSSLSLWEAVVAVSRFHNNDVDYSRIKVKEFCQRLDISIVQIHDEIGTLAIAAFAKYGKGRHKAKLNFGDCFSYACAKYLNVGLIYVGDDFDQTDLAQSKI